MHLRYNFIYTIFSKYCLILPKSDHISENTVEIMHNSIKERCALEEFTKALEYFPDMDEGTKDAP